MVVSKRTSHIAQKQTLGINSGNVDVVHDEFMFPKFLITTFLGVGMDAFWNSTF